VNGKVNKEIIIRCQ